jgi:hypothetical protein
VSERERERERKSLGEVGISWVATRELWGLNRWGGAFNVVAEVLVGKHKGGDTCTGVGWVKVDSHRTISFQSDGLGLVTWLHNNTQYSGALGWVHGHWWEKRQQMRLVEIEILVNSIFFSH